MAARPCLAALAMPGCLGHALAMPGHAWPCLAAWSPAGWCGSLIARLTRLPGQPCPSSQWKHAVSHPSRTDPCGARRVLPLQRQVWRVLQAVPATKRQRGGGYLDSAVRKRSQAAKGLTSTPTASQATSQRRVRHPGSLTLEASRPSACVGETQPVRSS